MDFTDLHALLHATYGEMMPLCAHMTGIAKGIAGLGALFYIALRIWSSLARAEPIDVFPLLRPFVLGFCIMFFPSVVLGTVNAVLSPVVQGTEKLVHVQQNDLQSLRDKRDKLEEEAYRRDKSRAYLVDDAAWDEKVQEMGFIGPEDAITLAGMYAERTAFNTKRWFVKKIYQALELVYNAASLVIDTLRTFILIVLSILGPIVFGIAVWDGLGGSLSAWFARYISVYLWLPVSSILTALLHRLLPYWYRGFLLRADGRGLDHRGRRWYWQLRSQCQSNGAAWCARRIYRRQGDDGRNGCRTRQCRRTDQGFTH